MEQVILNKSKQSKATILRSEKLKLKKIAVGSTIDIFQWKQPKKNTEEYEITINGRTHYKKSGSSLVVFSCDKSEFNVGENVFSVKALGDGQERIMDELKFSYSV